jgi:hypothetical protein
MNEIHRDFWFPVKRVGWGWGAPVKWQGWALIALYAVSIVATGIFFPPRQNRPMFATSALILTILFIVIVALKGERPLAWRSGKS